MWKVVWDRKVERDIKKIPDFIQEKFRFWVLAVQSDGLLSLRKQPGFHDEPLEGKRKGQRSVRLNKAYREPSMKYIKTVYLLLFKSSK